MSNATTWSDVEHQQSDITLVLPVSEALHLQALLAGLAADLESTRPRTVEERDTKRTSEVLARAVLERLRLALQPYDVPEALQDC